MKLSDKKPYLKLKYYKREVVSRRYDLIVGKNCKLVRRN